MSPPNGRALGGLVQFLCHNQLRSWASPQLIPKLSAHAAIEESRTR